MLSNLQQIALHAQLSELEDDIAKAQVAIDKARTLPGIARTKFWQRRLDSKQCHLNYQRIRVEAAQQYCAAMTARNALNN